MGVGRAALSSRLMRHFNLIYLSDMEDTTLSYMVEKILDWGFEAYIDKIKFLIKISRLLFFKCINLFHQLSYLFQRNLIIFSI